MCKEEDDKPQVPPVGPDGKEDVEVFLRSLNPDHKNCPPSIVEQLIEQRAIGCLTALLERKTSHNRLDFNRGIPLLSQAARNGFHEGVELFLRHGASPNRPIMGRTHQYFNHEQEMLPVDYALEKAMDTIERIDHKCYNDEVDLDLKWPLSDMIVWLVEWISQHFDTWRTLRLLGPATSRCQLEKRILDHTRSGHVTELFYLLLTVPDRVLSPTFFRTATWGKELDLDRRFANSSLRDFLAAQLAYLTALNMQWPHDDLKKPMGFLTTSLLLLEVFRRVGPQLSSLVATLEKDKEELFETEYAFTGLTNPRVGRETKAVLKGAGGFPLKSLNHIVKCYNNTDYRDLYCIYLQDPKYPELQFLNLPGYIGRSEVDSDFNRAIEMLCNHPYLKEWSPQMSPFKLLLIFCHPDLVEKMQYVLPFKLRSVNPTEAIQPTYLAELCSFYITEGRIVEFTAALMAVRVFLRLELPLRPQQLSRHDVNVVATDSIAPTVYEYLLAALRRVLDEEISLTGESKNSDSVKIFKERKLVVTSAFLLTEMFEKSAEHIYWFIHSAIYKEKGDLKRITKDFATLLKDLGYKLKAKDICLDDLECFSSKSRFNKTWSEANSSSSIGPHVQATSCVKGKDTNTTLVSLPASSISNLATRSYHTFPFLRYEVSEVDLTVKRVAKNWSAKPIINKSWRLLAMTKRIMRHL